MDKGKNVTLSIFVKFLSAFVKALSWKSRTFAPEINRVLFYAIPLGMGSTKNNKQSAQESPSVDDHRHKEAKEFTRQLVEELLSSSDASDKSGHGGKV